MSMVKSFFASASILTFAVLIGFSSSFAADPRVEQGARFEAKGEYEKALGEYRSILADDPRNSEAYYLAAQVRMKMKDYSGALANFRLAYRYNPSMSEAYEGAAKVYEALGQKPKAEAERAKDPKNNPVAETAAPAEPEVKSEPVKEEPKTEPAKVAERKVEAPAEEAAPVKEVKAEPEEPAVPAKSSVDELFEKGKALFDEGKYKEVVPVWREILAKRPGDPGAYFYAGLTRFELGEYDKAEYNLKKGLTFKERGNDANYFLALVYEKSKRKELEKKYLDAYLKKAAPSAVFRATAESRLAELRGDAVEAKPEAEKPAAPVQEKVEAKVEKEPKEKAPKKKAAPVSDDGPTIEVANMLFKSGNLEPALQMYKQLLDTELEPEERYFAMLQMGNIYRELRDFHSAATRYRIIVQEYPDSDWATEAERAQLEAIWQEKHASELPRATRR
ncbi:MAG: tetratricopeptide repeat protein [Fibrobacter sp.]|nr:tetratricopeptide repeat protein [Fibrobacter sp.]